MNPGFETNETEDNIKTTNSGVENLENIRASNNIPNPQNNKNIEYSETFKNSQNQPTQSKKTSIQKILKNKYIILLLTLIIGHITFYIIFRNLNQAYQTWDSAGHLGLTMRFADLYKEFFTGQGTTLYEIFTQSNYYPPLIHQFAALFNLTLGYNYNVLLSLIFTLFLITIYLLFKLVKEVGFSDKVAFFSAFFYSLFPLVADQSRLFHLEIPLILFLELCYLLLLRSKKFTSTKYTLLFFVSFAALQLVKWYGFLYLVVPVLYIFYLTYVSSKRTQILRKSVLNIALGSVIFLTVALPWYVLNLEELRLLSSLFSVGESDDPQVFFSVENLFFYLKGLAAYQIYFVPFLATLAGFIAFAKNNKKYALLLFIHMFLLYFVFTVIENKNQRYIFGLNLPFAFLMAYLVDKLNKRSLTVFLVLFSVFAFMFTSFNQIKAYSIDAKAWGFVLTGPFFDNFQVRPDLYSYDPYKPPIENVYNFILADAAFQGIEDVGVTPFVDHEDVSAATLEMVRNQMQLEDVFLPVPYYQFTPFKSDYEIIKFMRDKNVSYVIVPQHPGPEGLRNFAALYQGMQFMQFRSGEWFTQLKEFENKDNDLTVYRMKSWETGSKVNTCQTLTQSDGNFGITIEPLASLIMFTGHFDYKGISSAYQPGTLHILEINNYNTHPLGIDVTNLPLSGFSYCHRLGTRLKIKNEIAGALFENKQDCGAVECGRVVHTKVNGSNPLEKEVAEYTPQTFTGTGLERILKQNRIIPLYEDEYNIKDEIFVEYDVVK